MKVLAVQPGLSVQPDAPSGAGGRLVVAGGVGAAGAGAGCWTGGAVVQAVASNRAASRDASTPPRKYRRMPGRAGVAGTDSVGWDNAADGRGDIRDSSWRGLGIRGL